MTRLFVAISGLPASGKTALGRRLAPRLGLPLFDKDDILEALFDSLGAGDTESRSTLSRASDAVLTRLVSDAPGAVVTSFWRCTALNPSSGTPTEWMGSVPDARWVELYCEIDPDLAAARFRRRRRHVGHLDSSRSNADLLRQFRALADAGPIGLETCIRLDSSQPLNIPELVDRLHGSC